MSRVQADPALKDALTRNGDRVEVCDETGTVIGIAVSPAEMQKLQKSQQTISEMYARADSLFDPEELRAAQADPRRYSTEEVIRKLGLE